MGQAFLPSNVIQVVKPIYLDLVKPEELKKCLHGKTQNQNESFNSMIWECAPKITYCTYEKLELAVYDACAHFSDGRQATVDIFKILNICDGYYTRTMCYVLNKRRKYSAAYKSTASSKKERKVIRANKKKKVVKQKKKLKARYIKQVPFKYSIKELGYLYRVFSIYIVFVDILLIFCNIL